MTALPSAEVSASFSPDQESLAFQDEKGATYVLDLASGEVRELVTPLFGPGRPTWSADSATLAFASVRPYSQRFREGVSQILVVDVATGVPALRRAGRPPRVAVHPRRRRPRLVARRQEAGVRDGLAAARDAGRRDRYADKAPPGGSTARSPTPRRGAATHAGCSTCPRAVSASRTPAPARPGPWRCRCATGRTSASGRQVVHAGRFWDGQAEKLRRDVDITVVDNRIRSITPHRPHRSGKVVDASGLTVMPGLMDSHVHQAYESRFFGDRQGRVSLAWGITSTLSVGDQVYRAMEDRDSLRAGARVGPRFYATGEPVDGSRVYYNFMRPTRSDAQVRRELTRAKRLDYDFVKSYVRLQATRMAMVVSAAHALGVPSSSHYLTPGALVGQDGTTHLAATQRLGYAHTLTPTGHSYDDVPALYGRGNRTVTTTLFTTDFLTAGELEGDRRLRLLPPWKREALLAGDRGQRLGARRTPTARAPSAWRRGACCASTAQAGRCSSAPTARSTTSRSGCTPTCRRWWATDGRRTPPSGPPSSRRRATSVSATTSARCGPARWPT